MAAVTTKALSCFSEVISKPMKTTQLENENSRALGLLMNNMYAAMLDLLSSYNGIFDFENGMYHSFQQSLTLK